MSCDDYRIGMGIIQTLCIDISTFLYFCLISSVDSEVEQPKSKRSQEQAGIIN